jgi:hypothetical protein
MIRRSLYSFLSESDWDELGEADNEKSRDCREINSVSCFSLHIETGKGGIPAQKFIPLKPP